MLIVFLDESLFISIFACSHSMYDIAIFSSVKTELYFSTVVLKTS